MFNRCLALFDRAGTEYNAFDVQLQRPNAVKWPESLRHIEQ